MENELENDGHDYDEVASDDGILEVMNRTWIILKPIYTTQLLPKTVACNLLTI